MGSVLRPVPDRVRRVFRRLRRRCSYPPGVRLRIGDPAEFSAPRSFAYCAERPGAAPEIVFAPKIAGQPQQRVTALMAHELAHAILLARGIDHSERDCDAVARAVFGVPIRYDTDDVQTTGPGRRRRPRYLPR